MNLAHPSNPTPESGNQMVMGYDKKCRIIPTWIPHLGMVRGLLWVSIQKIEQLIRERSVDIPSWTQEKIWTQLRSRHRTTGSRSRGSFTQTGLIGSQGSSCGQLASTIACWRVMTFYTTSCKQSLQQPLTGCATTVYQYF